MKKFENMTTEEILKAKGSAGQQRDFSDKAGPVLVQMTAEDCQKQCKEAGVEYKKGYESRVLRYVCSDESVDRMGDIIKQDGWNLENFKKNPVIMGFHDYGTFPVGNALSVGVSDGKLKMNVLFADKDVNEDADKAFKMAKSGFMRAGSVGFNPKKYHMATENEVKDLGMGKFGLMFEEQELMEYSVCGVPANANALQESFSKGFKKSDFKGWVKEETLAELETKDVVRVEETETPEQELAVKEVVVQDPIFTEEQVKEIQNMLSTASKTTVIEKAGAVLSKKNKESVEQAIEGMTLATDALKSLLKNADNSKEEVSPDVSEVDEESSNSKSIIEIDLDSIDDTEDGEALYGDDNIINIDMD